MLTANSICKSFSDSIIRVMPVYHASIIFMPKTSKKFGRHIGLGLSVRPSVRPSVCYTCTRSRTVRDRILKFGM